MSRRLAARAMISFVVVSMLLTDLGLGIWLAPSATAQTAAPYHWARKQSHFRLRVGDNVDLVLSDVRMPRLDGPSLARRLPGRGRAVPVVPMSAIDVEVDLPGVRFLPKPFDRDHLLHVVGSALGANR